MFYRFAVNCFPIILAVFGGLAHSEEPEPGISIRTMVQAHVSTLAQLRSLRVQIVHETVGRQNSAVRNHHDAWFKRGALERFSRRTLLNLPNGDTRTYRHEVFLDYDAKEMASWSIADEANLTAIRPEAQNGLSAYKAPFDRNFLDFQVYNYFLLRFAFNGTDDWRTLAELVAEATTITASEEMLVGNKCSVLHIKNSAVDGEEDSVFHVFLDPTVGYLARQIVISHVAEGREPVEFVCNIDRFMDFGGGAYFPMESETYIVDTSGRRHKPNRFRVEDIEVNGTVSDAQVLTTFPEGSLVNLIDVPVTPTSVSTRSNVALIGKNSEVMRTFGQDSDEISEYLLGLKAELGDSSDVSPASNSFAIVRFLAIAIAVVVAAGLVRRWTNEQRPKA